MDGEPNPLEALTAAVQKLTREGPRRRAAAHNLDIEIRELALRVLEDLDARLKALEERSKE